MTVKASGRSALILATGLLVCLAGPPNAAATTDRNSANAKPETSGAPGKYARHVAQRWKRYAHHRYHQVEVKSSTDKTTEAADDGDRSTAIPPSVANANAQLAAADSPTNDEQLFLLLLPTRPSRDKCRRFGIGSFTTVLRLADCQ